MTRIALSEMGYVRYNANKDDVAKGDCAIRALSLAYNIPYEDVSKELRSHSRGKIFQYNELRNLKWFIDEHGYEGDEIFIPIEKYEPMKHGPVPTVEEFVDAHPNGTYLLLTGSEWMFGPAGVSHIVCCIDGDIYDSWNSSRHYVKYICIVDSANTNSIVTDRYTENEIEDYIIAVLDQAVDDYLLPYDNRDFVLLYYRGINPEDNSISMYSDFPYMPTTSCFFVHMKDEYTCSISVYMNTQAAKDLYVTFFRPKIDMKCHNNCIILKFSPKMTNDEIDQIIEKKVVSEIKKLKKLLTKEQELCDQVEQGDMWSDFPMLDLKYMDSASQGRVYDLLKNCKDDIKKRVIKVTWNTWEKAWNLVMKALPKDERNNNYMIVSEKGKVELDGNNAKQINKCYDQYLADIISYGGGSHYYSYDQL